MSLRTLVARHLEMADELPIIHTSQCEHLAAITSSHTLKPQRCLIFSESLIYLFYGRPAYRSPRGSRGGEPIALCPVCFVFKPRTVSRVLHGVFPCDTGAVVAGKFLPEIRPDDLTNLALDPRIQSARRAVHLLFGDNYAYFLGRVVSGKTFKDGSIEARFYELLQRRGPADFDDRKSAIELQVKDPISLKEQLLGVVLPQEFLEEPAIRNAIFNVWNCDPVPYSTVEGDAPAAYYSVVRQKVTEWFERATRI